MLRYIFILLNVAFLAGIRGLSGDGDTKITQYVPNSALTGTEFIEEIVISKPATVNSFAKFEQQLPKGMVAEGLDIKGVGPVFNYIRIIKGFIRFNYDTVRIHHETLCVRKYLPEINKSSKLNKNQKLIILNSEGTVSPYDLMIPYNIHARDIFRAYQAWLTEDMEYIKKEFVPYKMENSAGLIRPDKKNPQLYRKKGVKLKFSYWFTTAVLRYHKKQREAYVDFCKRQHKFIKLYDPFRYEEKIRRDTISSTLRRKNNSDEKKQFRRLTVKINRNKSRNKTINQPELL
jgi:hypothetical protein